MKPNRHLLLLAAICFCQQLLAQPERTVNEKLSIISYLYINDNYTDPPADSILRKYFRVEAITKDQFLAQQKTKVNWSVADTTRFRKKKGVLRLPTAAGPRTFTDKIIDDESRKEYDCIGHIPVLNSYIVRGLFWEEVEYNLVSKKDGATIGFFNAVPHLSPDKKRIISLYADPYETNTEVSLYSNVNGNIKNTVTIRFENWMPGDDDLVFWGKDGKLYVPFQPTEKFWGEDGNYNTDYLYLRISLL